MDALKQRRRLVTAMGITTACVILAVGSMIASYGFHVGWAIWVFVAALLVGFASHIWLIVGALRDRSGSS
jgi:hypothetical protein